MSILDQGLELKSEGHYESAIEVLSRCPDDVYCVFHLGRAHAMAGHMPQAMECFARVADLDWEDMFYENNPYFNQGIVLFCLGNISAAGEMFDRAKRTTPLIDLVKFHALFVWSGICRHLQKRYYEAVQDYALAISAAKDFAGASIGVEDLLMHEAASQNEIKLSDFDYEYGPCFVELNKARTQELTLRIQSSKRPSY